jgi:hypothetical protein
MPRQPGWLVLVAWLEHPVPIDEGPAVPVEQDQQKLTNGRRHLAAVSSREAENDGRRRRPILDVHDVKQRDNGQGRVEVTASPFVWTKSQIVGTGIQIVWTTVQPADKFPCRADDRPPRAIGAYRLARKIRSRMHVPENARDSADLQILELRVMLSLSPVRRRVLGPAAG